MSSYRLQFQCVCGTTIAYNKYKTNVKPWIRHLRQAGHWEGLMMPRLEVFFAAHIRVTDATRICELCLLTWFTTFMLTRLCLHSPRSDALDNHLLSTRPCRPAPLIEQPARRLSQADRTMVDDDEPPSTLTQLKNCVPLSPLTSLTEPTTYSPFTRCSTLTPSSSASVSRCSSMTPLLPPTRYSSLDLSPLTSLAPSPPMSRTPPMPYTFAGSVPAMPPVPAVEAPTFQEYLVDPSSFSGFMNEPVVANLMLPAPYASMNFYPAFANNPDSTIVHANTNNPLFQNPTFLVPVGNQDFYGESSDNSVPAFATSSFSEPAAFPDPFQAYANDNAALGIHDPLFDLQPKSNDSLAEYYGGINDCNSAVSRWFDELDRTMDRVEAVMMKEQYSQLFSAS